MAEEKLSENDENDQEITLISVNENVNIKIKRSLQNLDRYVFIWIWNHAKYLTVFYVNFLR